ncbi:hypothetical protein AA23498_2338 [Acetobacter nitrogenifigens DSM 23921 = NBRC 105050]|uniref:Uncharacterized protein n=1 Tax=Acetobacter nitrogenifigens DSM 23921 = NBRC 105050 TaxID=1120919 RepID=A0A511X7C4_9PROT|nr:hypothetical protein AA23498_2338 [Acetobacter nitrogenifigens DSM 23921 = NBRC 105050]GEN58840.1 hypothetical protein ANI02nite_07240 [Acetobacter nitrogenifigens DSM 23921 = NBRC 105050]
MYFRKTAYLQRVIPAKDDDNTADRQSRFTQRAPEGERNRAQRLKAQYDVTSNAACSLKLA